MRLLFFTDPHIRLKNPASRKDNYYETILNKLKWVKEIGEELEVEAYLCGGDILDRPDTPYSLITELASLLTEFEKPIYTVLGNHDLYGYNPGTHYRTALGVLTETGLLRRLSKEPTIFEDGDTKVSITGVDAHRLLDVDGRVEDYTEIQRVDDAVNINIVHGFLSKTQWPNVDCTVIKDILDTNADITLTGHEHIGFMENIDGKYFVNPGALGRVTASVGDVNQVVKVAVIEIRGDEYTVDFLEVPEEIAKPASEVLDRDALVREKVRQESLESIKQMAELSERSLGGFDGEFSIKGTISELKKSGIEENVLSYIEGKLYQADEELKD